VDERIILRTMDEREMSRSLLIDPPLSWHFGGISGYMLGRVELPSWFLKINRKGKKMGGVKFRHTEICLFCQSMLLENTNPTLQLTQNHKQHRFGSSRVEPEGFF
jgi:hypothetical protein